MSGSVVEVHQWSFFYVSSAGQASIAFRARSEKNGAAKHAIDELEPDLTKPDGIYKILMNVGLEMCIGRVS